MTITWKESKHGGYHGYLGSIHIFTIFWGIGQGEKWKLGVDLPGFKERSEFTGELEDTKELAEMVLSRWLQKTGLKEAE